MPRGKDGELYTWDELERGRVSDVKFLPEYREPRRLEDRVIEDEEGFTVADLVPGVDGREEMETAIRRREVRDLIDEVLTRREQFIIIRRMWGECTLEEIATVLGLSRERVRQIEGGIIEKLRGYAAIPKKKRERLAWLNREAPKMPVKVAKKKGKYRVVESATGKIAKTDKGNARDSGGHDSEEKAKAQARAINASMNRGR